MKLGDDERLYLITDTTRARWPLTQVVAEAVRSGVKLVQLREKHLPDEAYLELAQQVRQITAQCGARLLINSRLHCAQAVAADGVHLPRDASIAEARAVVGADALIGVSTHSAEEVRRAATGGADLVTLSPVFPTESKPGYDAAALGLERFRVLVQTSPLPVFALGGVRIENALACLEAGAYGIAVMSTIMWAADVPQTVRGYLRRLSGLSGAG